MDIIRGLSRHTPAFLTRGINQETHAIASEMTDRGSVATRPIVSHRNQMLSSTGGLGRDIIEPFIHPNSVVRPISHHDAKKLMLTAHKEARLTFNSTKAKAGL